MPSHKFKGIGHNFGCVNGQWKGDNVGRIALHEWVRNRIPQPILCEKCHKRKSYDLANRSGKYLRDLSDWEYLCRKCHMESDGRMKNLNRNPLLGEFRNCRVCGKQFYTKRSRILIGQGNCCSKHCARLKGYEVEKPQ